MRHTYLIALTLLAVIAGGWMVPAHADGLPPVTAQDQTLGDPKAPVTVIEYASVGCPHCAEFDKDVFPQVKTNFIDTGKIYYVFRDFPIWAWAARAAVLAHCGGREHYFAFVETLFQQQDQWGEGVDDKPREQALRRIAMLGGITPKAYQSCESDPKLMQQVTAAEQGGDDAGVQGTPTFFINGKLVFGRPPSYDEFAAAVAAAAPAK